jgi:DNA-binding PadR family transcriptional regulator
VERNRHEPEGALYRITVAGRRQLAAEKAEWDRMTAIMHTLLHDQG